MKQNFCHLDWDTDFFGFKVARIVCTDLIEIELLNTLKVLRDNNYRMVYWSVPVEQNDSYCIALAHGAFLANEKLTYCKSLTGSSDKPKIYEYTTDSYSGIVPDSTMIDLALQSSKHSRFRIDPMFPQDLCDKLYTYWIMRSVSKEIAWDVLIATKDSNIIGLVTLCAKGEYADIGLLAVMEYERNKGVGQKLVVEAEKYFIKKGFTKAQVVTQRLNLEACRLYEACGYKINKVEYIFHFWL